ncbi:MAG: VWA domain-containing protein [Anaerolineae bacterium]|nr:VWA domain-containing protein [Anaerolineae bacterium]
MKKLLPLLFLVAALLPVTLFAMQDSSAVRIEITGVNATELPTAVVTANVYDNLGQPIGGLTAADFALTGSLAQVGEIVEVQNITDDDLPFATVLVLDVSSSMSGVVEETSPIGRARAAAREFVENVREGDPVALVTFSTGVNVVQPFTTDKAAILAAIDNAASGGETALYQAGYDAVRLAAEAPVSRRVVILLSDGAEYGGNSTVERDAAALEALTRGVPVYTIGLGFGADRTYLENLADSTNARFYESPTPEQLDSIYTELAALLRSQYVITLNADVPLDGTTYDFGIRVTTPAGSDEATAELRAPIPTPVVSLPDLPTDPIIVPTTLTANVLADDALTGVSFAFDDAEPVTLNQGPFTFTIDPAQFAPGSYPLSVAATDENGDVGIASGTVLIGALPPTVSFDPDLASLGEIAEAVTVAIIVGGQTPITDVSVAIDDQAAVALTEPYSFTVDPIQLPPGEHQAVITVHNEGGREAVGFIPFNVAAVIPVVTIRGLEDGQSITEPTTFTVTVTGQGAVTALTAAAGDTPLTRDTSGLIGIDPMVLPPGAADVVVSATTDNGVTGEARVTVLIGALPPQIRVEGIAEGANLTGDVEIMVDFVSQTPITDAVALVDSETAAALESDPTVFTLRVLDYPPGEHTLNIGAQNASGQTNTLAIPFTIDPAPAASATALAQMQATATQAVINATVSAEAAAATATQAAVIAATQTAEFIAQATATAVVQNATGTAQVVAEATQAAVIAATRTSEALAEASATAAALSAAATDQAQIAATQTSDAAAAVAAASATASAEQAAVNAASTQTAEAEASQAAEQTTAANLAATQTAEANAVTQAAEAEASQAAEQTAAANLAATQTADAEASQAAEQTAAANLAATQTADAEASQAAEQTAAANLAATQTADAEASQAAEQTAAANLAASATAAAAEATVTGEAALTAEAQRLATESAGATATNQQQLLDIQATVQVATRDALATSNAEARQNAQATQDARSTRSAATEIAATQAAINTATAEAEVTITAENAATATAMAEEAAAEATRSAEQTQAAQQTADAATAIAATDQAATQAQSTLFADETATAIAEAIATETAQAEANAAATTAAEESALAVTATAIIEEATQRAALMATDDGATMVMQTDVARTEGAQTRVAATAVVETQSAEQTLSAQQTAVAPTATPLDGGAQAATEEVTPTAEGTLTPITADSPPTGGDIVPLLLVALAALVILLLLFFALRGNRRRQ